MAPSNTSGVSRFVYENSPPPQGPTMQTHQDQGQSVEGDRNDSTSPISSHPGGGPTSIVKDTAIAEKTDLTGVDYLNKLPGSYTLNFEDFIDSDHHFGPFLDYQQPAVAEHQPWVPSYDEIEQAMEQAAVEYQPPVPEYDVMEQALARNETAKRDVQAGDSIYDLYQKYPFPDGSTLFDSCGRRNEYRYLANYVYGDSMEPELQEEADWKACAKWCAEAVRTKDAALTVGMQDLNLSLNGDHVEPMEPESLASNSSRLNQVPEYEGTVQLHPTLTSKKAGKQPERRNRDGVNAERGIDDDASDADDEEIEFVKEWEVRGTMYHPVYHRKPKPRRSKRTEEPQQIQNPLLRVLDELGVSLIDLPIEYPPPAGTTEEDMRSLVRYGCYANARRQRQHDLTVHRNAQADLFPPVYVAEREQDPATHQDSRAFNEQAGALFSSIRRTQCGRIVKKLAPESYKRVKVDVGKGQWEQSWVGDDDTEGEEEDLPLQRPKRGRGRPRKWKGPPSHRAPGQVIINQRQTDGSWGAEYVVHERGAESTVETMEQSSNGHADVSLGS